MMRTHYKKIVAALALAACSAGASAVGLGFLAETPMAYLNKNDKPALLKAVTDVLNDKKDGESVQWSNEGLRNSVRIAADITASETEKTDAQVCRKVQLALNAKGQEQTLKLKLCKAGTQGWKVAKT
jgi:surface antigen